MAKILYSSLIDGIRGRSGGVIFSGNASGPLVRRYSPPIARQTAAQLPRRATFASMGNLWRALTGAQRTAWNAWGAAVAQAKTDSLGNTYYLNGYQWFVSANCNLALVGRAAISAAPTLAAPSPPTIGTLVVDAPGASGNTQAITVASFGTKDMVIEMNWTMNESRQVAVEKNYLFVLGVQNASLAASTNLGNLQLIFGVVAANTFWISRVYAQNADGRRSTFVSATDVAT